MTILGSNQEKVLLGEIVAIFDLVCTLLADTVAPMGCDDLGADR